jgi:hypothetical protein
MLAGTFQKRWKRLKNWLFEKQITVVINYRTQSCLVKIDEYEYKSISIYSLSY